MAIAFQNINPNELTVWHTDDQEPPKRELGYFVENELPQGVEHKKANGYRELAVQMARAVVDGNLRRHNAFICDDNTTSSETQDQEILSQAKTEGLDLEWANNIGNNYSDGALKVLKYFQPKLTEGNNQFYTAVLSGGFCDSVIPKVSDDELEFPLNYIYRGSPNTICQIAKTKWKEGLNAFFTNFDRLVGLVK
jgi:hypothetical protein